MTVVNSMLEQPLGFSQIVSYNTIGRSKKRRITCVFKKSLNMKWHPFWRLCLQAAIWPYCNCSGFCEIRLVFASKFPYFTQNPQKTAIPLPLKRIGLSCARFGTIYGTRYGTICFLWACKDMKNRERRSEFVPLSLKLRKIQGIANIRIDHTPEKG